MKTWLAQLAWLKPVLAGLLYTSLSMFGPELVSAQPAGALDPTFAGSGQSIVGFAGGHQWGLAAAVQSDGKLVIAGETGDGYGGATRSFEIVRFDTNNVLDLSFGAGGVVFTSFGPESDFAEGGGAFAVGIQPDGKIVAGGWVDTTGLYANFGLARYNPDGSLDPSFGIDGRVLTDFGVNSQINALVIQVDGKIVASGFAGTNFALARYQTNGVLDASFGTGGTVTTDVGGIDIWLGGTALMIVGGGQYLTVGSGLNGTAFAAARYTTNGVLDTTFGSSGVSLTTIPGAYSAWALAVGYQLGNNTVLNPDKLVLVGDVNYATNGTFGLVRLNLNGTLDTTFGNNGIVTNVFTTGGGGARGTAVVVQGFLFHPRKITVGGFGTGGFGLARFNADGSLDTTFGGGTGKVTVPLSPVGEDQAWGMVFQAGKLVLVGDSFETIGYPDSSVIEALRFNSDGSLDTTFGSGGVVTADVASPSEARAVAVQLDGRLVVGGVSFNGTVDGFALARYNANGTLDGSFGSLGKVLTAIGPSHAGAESVALQPDGKIVAAGYSYTGTSNYFIIALARYNPNGSPDTAFGSGGQVLTTLVGYYDAAMSVAVQPDGRIVTAGYSYNLGLFTADFAVLRYLPNGTLDSSFGGTGKVTTSIADGFDQGRALVIQPDGKIVVAGSGQVGSNTNFALVRYNSDGSLDPAFGAFGRVSTDFGSGNPSYAVGLALQPDGKLVAAGRVVIGGIGYFALTRYLPSGTLDASFGTGGKVTTQLGLSFDEAEAVAVMPNGKIVATGASWQGAFARDAVVRYNPDGSLDGSYGIGGKVIVSFDDAYDNAWAVAVDQIGRVVLAGDANNLFGVARLTSEPFLKFTSITPTNGGQMLLQGLGVPGTNHTLYASPNLAPGSFSTLAPITTDAGGFWQYLDTSAAGISRRSYRFSFP
jgi:uncharacterized delta-60 repeat protein